MIFNIQNLLSKKLTGKCAAAWLLLFCMHAVAQNTGSPVPQGSSVPAFSAIPFGTSGPGYLEVGGSYSGLTNQFSSWRDGYARGVFSGANNTFGLEVTRQNRYGDSGWFGSGDWTRALGTNWYSTVDVGSSVGGFFIPKLRADGFINRKLLPHKQLVLNGGVGYDKSKIQNSALRGEFGGMYYFQQPFVLQGEVTWTKASPGGIVARSQSLAVTQGHEKEHYVSFRAEFGREGYELV